MVRIADSGRFWERRRDERRRRERRREWSGEQWIEHAFRWRSDAILICDRDHAVRDANPAAEALFERPLAQMVGQPALELVAPHRRAELQAIQSKVEQMLDDPGRGWDSAYHVEWADQLGPPRRLAVTVSAIRDEVGELVGFGVVLQDVTAIRRAEAQQKAIAELSAAALQARDVQAVFDAAVSIPHVFLGADCVALLELVRDGRELVVVSATRWPQGDVLRRLRVPVEAGTLLGDTVIHGEPVVLESLAPEHRRAMLGELARCQPDLEAAATARLQVQHRPWGVLCVTWRGPRRIDPDEVDALQTQANVIATVVERERGDQLRLQHERALRLGSLGRMAAGVAHDLANVLAGIETVAAVEAQRGGLDEAALGSLDQIQREAQLGHGIIDDILDFARLAPLSPEPTALGSWLGSQRGALEALVPPHCTIEVLAPEPGPVVEVDPLRLRRVMSNLVDNAADALREEQRGRILIELATVQVLDGDQPAEGMAPGTYARIDVADDAPGIDPEVLPRIFEPFFTTKSHRQGTGLGLAQVHGVVLQHGGHIAVRSDPGGTVFSLWLAVAPAAEPPD